MILLAMAEAFYNVLVWVLRLCIGLLLALVFGLIAIYLYFDHKNDDGLPM